MDLRGNTFELVENHQGSAQVGICLVFNGHANPFEATYSGPGIAKGHALVVNNSGTINMVYHAFVIGTGLVAGKAKVELMAGSEELKKMKLLWQWLTGDKSSGVSTWIEIKNN